MEEFRQIRRKERALSREETLALLASETWGVLSVQGDHGYPYGVPVNYAFAEGKLYIHTTAADSHRSDGIARSPKVCFTVVPTHELLPADYSTRYESVIVFGAVRVLTTYEEKLPALEKMMARLAPEVRQEALSHCGSLKNMVMLEITPDHISGKARK